MNLAFKVGGAIYAASALLFLSEIVGEVSGYYLFSASWVVHEIIAVATLLGFVTGGILIWRSNNVVVQRNREVERLLRAAQGEFYKMLHLQFDQWELSDAERDVALLTVKGMSVSEIADLRNTSQGTIKSQNNSIYRKANVKSRTQLLGALIEELLVDE